VDATSVAFLLKRNLCPKSKNPSSRIAATIVHRAKAAVRPVEDPAVVIEAVIEAVIAAEIKVATGAPAAAIAASKVRPKSISTS
jgi:hypothetical protein